MCDFYIPSHFFNVHKLTESSTGCGNTSNNVRLTAGIILTSFYLQLTVKYQYNICMACLQTEGSFYINFGQKPNIK